MRQAIDIPIDIHTETRHQLVGFIRHYEVPEMVRVCSTFIFKNRLFVCANT